MKKIAFGQSSLGRILIPSAVFILDCLGFSKAQADDIAMDYKIGETWEYQVLDTNDSQLDEKRNFVRWIQLNRIDTNQTGTVFRLSYRDSAIDCSVCTDNTDTTSCQVNLNGCPLSSPLAVTVFKEHPDTIGYGAPRFPDTIQAAVVRDSGFTGYYVAHTYYHSPTGGYLVKDTSNYYVVPGVGVIHAYFQFTHRLGTSRYSWTLRKHDGVSYPTESSINKIDALRKSVIAIRYPHAGKRATGKTVIYGKPRIFFRGSDAKTLFDARGQSAKPKNSQ